MKVTDAEIDALPMSRHRFHGDWNYRLHPGGPQPTSGQETGSEAAAAIVAEQPKRPNGLDASLLRDPELTGMAIPQPDALVNVDPGAGTPT